MATVPFPTNLSPQGPNAGMSWELRSLTGINRSSLNGVATTLERPGAHFALRFPYSNLATDRRARLETFAMAHRGSANRFHVPVFGWTRRGSFPATELLTNNYFTSTTGWTASGGIPVAALTAADGILRMTQTAATINPQAKQTGITAVQYAPYCARAVVLHGLGSTNVYRAFLEDGVSTIESTDGVGLRNAVGVVLATNVNCGFYKNQNPATGIAGDFFEAGYASLARCALVDNGLNALLRSDSPSNASWTKVQSSASAVAGIAPDGASDAEAIIENSATNFHYIEQSASRSSAVEDLCAYGYFKRRTGTRDVAIEIDDGASNGAICIFDLNAGTAGTAGAAGAGTNPRAFIRSAGDGWYYCAVVARCPATTTIRAQVLMNSAGNNSYTGDGSSSIYAWRMGAARSSTPTRGAETTSTAFAGGTSQTGGALYLKGLPASASGLLLQGDPAEIIIGTTSQLVRTRGSLNSDAAGLGYWQFEPPLRVSPSDNAAVIVQNPLCKMMMENNVASWTDRLGGFSDLEFSAVEDTYPS